MLSASTGGCGILDLLSFPEISNTTYPASKSHGVQSIEFGAPFPNAFAFTACKGYHCSDLRWEILGVNVAFAVVGGLVLDPPALVWVSPRTVICLNHA